MDNQISVGKFQYYRVKQLGRAAKFTKVQIDHDTADENQSSGDSLTIIFPGGAKLEIASLSLEDLKELLS